MTQSTTHWGLHQFADQKEIRLQWDRLRIRLIKRGSDLLLVEIRDNREIAAMGNDPESDFRRYAFDHELQTIEVQPRMPDRPILVQPLHPLRLASKAEVDFYVSLPVDIQLASYEGGTSQPMERLRSELLSDSWFGDQLQGLLCYALKSRARRERPQPGPNSSGRAICKIRIYNHSDIQLHFTRFCLRLEHCHLWEMAGELWTSPIHIRYRGTNQLSAIDYSEEAPEELVGCQQITRADKEPTKGLIGRTFAGLGNAFASI